MSDPRYINHDEQTKQFSLQGDWTLDNITHLITEAKKATWPKSGNIILNGKSITKMDSAGAWFINSKLKEFLPKKSTLQLTEFSQQFQSLIEFIKKQSEEKKSPPHLRIPGWIEELGKYSLEQATGFHQFLSFVGQLFFESLRTATQPSLWRWPDIISQINKTGSQALPIIALLSFTIGIVISYQMGDQLRTYGANVFIVNLLGLSVLREFGPLLSAIMIAGRTGSSFTAQLGIMKIKEEIDAINTMGVTPGNLLLLPRLIALIIIMPLLTIWADIFGILGGMVMANSMLDISWPDFLIRFKQEIPLRALFIGLGKAPIFAMLIASIACFQGMKVVGSAENVGARTTRSVVLSIFFIIIVDGFFSILFSKFDL